MNDKSIGKRNIRVSLTYQWSHIRLMHTDVCQVDTKSHAGAQYFVMFIDDHIRRLWATPLKTKNKVLSVFKELHAREERESGRKLKAVRADNRGEYRGQFEEYYRSKGIRLEFTVPKTLSWRFSYVGGKPSEASKPAMCNVAHPHVVFISCR